MKALTICILLLSATSLMTISSCTKDLCEHASCLNGGECIDGSCNCTEQFTGQFCAEQNTPDKIRIRTIQLTRFPGMNNGIGWDEKDGPDLYFRLYEGDTPLAQPIISFDNADDTQDYFFFIEDIDVRNVFATHRLELRDYDPTDADDIMGEVSFTLYDSENEFPKSMILDNGGDVAYFVELEYLYNKNE